LNLYRKVPRCDKLLDLASVFLLLISNNPCCLGILTFDFQFVAHII
jgi:hypothetical protein